jgi:TfoX/Sxy family transcriptional regulator of competence genes
MALNVELTKRVRDVLAKFEHVEEKKMFRGIAFMVNGKMCVTVGDTRLMCRIDPSMHAEAVARVGVSTVKMKGKDYIGWVYVDESVIADKRKLTYWIKLALAFNKNISKG